MPKPEEIAEKLVKHLEESLLDYLKEEMKKMIASAVQIQFEGLNKRLSNLSKTMDMWKNDLDYDRDNIQSLRVGYENMATEIKEIRRDVDALPKKLGEKVEQSVNNSVAESVPQAVSDTFDLTNKKVKVFEKPKGLLAFLWK